MGSGSYFARQEERYGCNSFIRFSITVDIQSKLAGYIVVFALCTTTFFAGGTKLLDLKLLDWQFSVLRELGRKPVVKEVVVVGIDEETIRQLSEPMTLWHPHLGKFLEVMTAAKPAAIGLDLILPERSYDSLLPGYDKLLLSGILATRESVPVILGLTIDRGGKTRAIYSPFVSVAGKDSLGYTLIPLDADKIARHFDEHLGEGGIKLPTLAGQVARKMNMQPKNGIINYALGDAFDYIPLHKLLVMNATELRNQVNGKAVLLGGVMPFEDRQLQPVNLASWEKNNGNFIPGV
jgi:CHASE2 domain-containing sensor protein